MAPQTHVSMLGPQGVALLGADLVGIIIALLEEECYCGLGLWKYIYQEWKAVSSLLPADHDIEELL